MSSNRNVCQGFLVKVINDIQMLSIHTKTLYLIKKKYISVQDQQQQKKKKLEITFGIQVE